MFTRASFSRLLARLSCVQKSLFRTNFGIIQKCHGIIPGKEEDLILQETTLKFVVIYAMSGEGSFKSTTLGMYVSTYIYVPIASYFKVGRLFARILMIVLNSINTMGGLRSI